MIELRGVTKIYRTPFGPNVVLDELTARFPPKTAVGILGRNGAGKSTLLRIIGGAELPDAGSVIRRGLISWPIGFQGGFNGSLTGEENCRFVARIYGQCVDRVVDETRAFADLGNYFFMPVRTYSSGMRARLAFGLSMAIDFDAYLVDEVTAVGDQRFRRRCQEAFAARRERAALIMVSHRVETLKEYCSRCAVLQNGRLVMFDSVEEAADVYSRELAA
ncbi:MAG: ABC transporter ATP-binding protein [Deltaproteobacteria bacterium]|nr:MAG: ABC transporter ATP-binding protein [Deltaproteobacteria bacterium]